MSEYIKTTGGYFYKTYKNGKSVRVSKDEYNRNNKIVGGYFKNNSRQNNSRQNILSSKNINLFKLLKLNNVRPLVIYLEKGYNPNIQNSENYTPLMVATDFNRTEHVKQLLNHGANPNITEKHGITALMIACIRGYTNIVQLLLDKNADVNIDDDFEYNALMYAVKKNHKEIVELLLNKNAKFNRKIFRLAKNADIRELLFKHLNLPRITGNYMM